VKVTERNETGRPRLTAVGLALVAILAFVSCQGARTEVRSRSDAALTDLTDLKNLQDHFNRDAGTPRLVLLMSPT